MNINLNSQLLRIHTFFIPMLTEVSFLLYSIHVFYQSFANLYPHPKKYKSI